MDIANPDLRGFVESAKKIEGVSGIILYGSTSDVMDNSDSSSDIDLFVCLDSDTFRTELEPYKEIAKLTYGRIKPAIKSIKEFSVDNYVSFTRRNIQHLNNVAEVLYESPDLDLEGEISHMWNQTAQDSYKIDDAYKIAQSFKIRHRLFELCRGITTKIMDDKQTRFESPSKSFWQNVSDIFTLYLSADDEKHIIPIVSEQYVDDKQPGPWRGRIDITAAEYQDYIYRTVRDEINMLNERLKKEGMTKAVIKSAIGSYFEYKNLIEDNMWLLNKFKLEGISNK